MQGIQRYLRFALLCLAALGQPAWADICVVVHRDSPLRDLSSSQVSDLYLGRSRSLPGSEAIIIIEREPDGALRARFFQQLNGMSLKQLNAYWARLQFSGQVLPPPSVRETRDVLGMVRANRMAIAYVDAAEVDDSVRVVLRLPEGG